MRLGLGPGSGAAAGMEQRLPWPWSSAEPQNHPEPASHTRLKARLRKQSCSRTKDSPTEESGCREGQTGIGQELEDPARLRQALVLGQNHERQKGSNECGQQMSRSRVPPRGGGVRAHHWLPEKEAADADHCSVWDAEC